VNAKKILFWILNLGLIGATNGLWLVILIPFIIWRRQKTTAIEKVSKQSSRTTKLNSSKKQFAVDGGRGEIFSYASLKKGNSLDAPFAVIDLETTGLDKAKHRVIEIAIRRIQRDGTLLDEFSTLIDPQGIEVGPTFVHHITADDLVGAPTFAEISSLVVSRLSGCIAVAHHAAFEDGFLSSEFKKAGVSLPKIPCIDTLWLAQTVTDLPNYRLGTVVNSFGIDEVDAHTALGDVRMVSQLLPRLLDSSKPLYFKEPLSAFESAAPLGKLKTRASNLRKGKEGWLANLARKLPDLGSGVSTEITVAYNEILSRVLADGKITGEEAKELAKFAGASGLGSTQLQDLHRDYFAAIEKLAYSDGTLSDAELRDLALLKSQLGI
jgi:DNA polymerase-3 subunit epsilon